MNIKEEKSNYSGEEKICLLGEEKICCTERVPNVSYILFYRIFHQILRPAAQNVGEGQQGLSGRFIDILGFQFILLQRSQVYT